MAATKSNANMHHQIARPALTPGTSPSPLQLRNTPCSDDNAFWDEDWDYNGQLQAVLPPLTRLMKLVSACSRFAVAQFTMRLVPPALSCGMACK